MVMFNSMPTPPYSRFEAQFDDYSIIMVKALADRLAEVSLDAQHIDVLQLFILDQALLASSVVSVSDLWLQVHYLVEANFLF